MEKALSNRSLAAFAKGFFCLKRSLRLAQFRKKLWLVEMICGKKLQRRLLIAFQQRKEEA